MPHLIFLACRPSCEANTRTQVARVRRKQDPEFQPLICDGCYCLPSQKPLSDRRNLKNENLNGVNFTRRAFNLDFAMEDNSILHKERLCHSTAFRDARCVAKPRSCVATCASKQTCLAIGFPKPAGPSRTEMVWILQQPEMADVQPGALAAQSCASRRHISWMASEKTSLQLWRLRKVAASSPFNLAASDSGF